MSLINISFDTVEKTMAVSVDGKKVENVVEASVCKNYYEDDGDFGCCITTSTSDESNGTRMMTRLVASASPEGKEAVVKNGISPSPLEGFVISGSNSKLDDDIAAYFKRKS